MSVGVPTPPNPHHPTPLFFSPTKFAELELWKVWALAPTELRQSWPWERGSLAMQRRRHARKCTARGSSKYVNMDTVLQTRILRSSSQAVAFTSRS